MAVPRPILLAIAGLVLVVGAFVATRGAGGDGGGSSSEAPAPAPRSTTASKDGPASTAGRPEKPATAPKSTEPVTRSGTGSGAALLSKPKPGPARLARALARGNLVVLFVRQPGAADDRATARSVAALRRGHLRHVTIASIPIRDISDYKAITGRAGVSQAPAIVLSKGPRGGSKGLLLEGYIDPASLRQHVADATK